MTIQPSFPKRMLAVFLCCLLTVPGLCPAAYAASFRQLSASSGETMIHILLIGQDRREEESASRSDSIILCTFCPEKKNIIITSFLRDLYVKIPDHQNNRLNAAYAFGGMELLQQTIEENFQIPIHGCIEADFSQFPQIIDVLGGVSIELRKDEADSINQKIPGTLTEGVQTLNGNQALAYSRIRNLDSDGDFSRTARQRKLISSLLDRYRDASLLTILSAVVDTLPMVTTTLSKKQIIMLTAKLFPLLDAPRFTNQRIPADGTFCYQTIRDMEVLTADLEEIRTQLQNSFNYTNDITS